MAPGPAALVIRFSSLGDVLLAAHVPGFLREADPERRVLFATKERYADLLRGHPHVDRFYALSDRTGDPAAPAPMGIRGGLGDLAAALRREAVAEIYDLHQNLRSARLTRALETPKRVAPPKHSLRRRLWVHARWLKPRAVPPLLRTYRRMCGLDPTARPAPWLRAALTPAEIERAAGRVGEGLRATGFALLGVGAKRETKRWPAGRFAELAVEIRRELRLGALFAAAPGDPAAEELRSILPAAGGAALLCAPFREVMAVAAHARAIVSNDSAVLHLGPALGVPSVGIFGSTVPEFGFARQSPCDEAVEIPMRCRPCGVHGRARCPLGHHACMRRLEPGLVREALGRVLERAGPRVAAAGSPA